MTREEAIERVKTMRWEHATNKDNPDHEAMTMAIQALENQPRFLVHSDGKIEQIIEPCDDVLGKIKAEIMELDYDDYDRYEGTNISPMVCRDLVMEIIDKYRKEQLEE